MVEPMWIQGDDEAWDKDTIEDIEQAKYNDAEASWECDNDK